MADLVLIVVYFSFQIFEKQNRTVNNLYLVVKLFTLDSNPNDKLENNEHCHLRHGHLTDTKGTLKFLNFGRHLQYPDKQRHLRYHAIDGWKTTVNCF